MLLAARELETPHKLICSEGFDLSSRVASIEVAVKPERGVVVTKQILLSSNSVKKEVRKSYPVITGRRPLGLKAEPEGEQPTRLVERGTSFNSPRVGFAKLKTR